MQADKRFAKSRYYIVDARYYSEKLLLKKIEKSFRSLRGYLFRKKRAHLLRLRKFRSTVFSRIKIPRRNKPQGVDAETVASNCVCVLADKDSTIYSSCKCKCLHPSPKSIIDGVKVLCVNDKITASLRVKCLC